MSKEICRGREDFQQDTLRIYYGPSARSGTLSKEYHRVGGREYLVPCYSSSGLRFPPSLSPLPNSRSPRSSKLLFSLSASFSSSSSSPASFCPSRSSRVSWYYSRVLLCVFFSPPANHPASRPTYLLGATIAAWNLTFHIHLSSFSFSFRSIGK